jgi:hypothetical protein
MFNGHTRGDIPMIDEPEPILVLLSLVEGIPLSPPAPRRGRPDVYADYLILKGLVVMLVRRVWQAHGLLAILHEPTPRWPVSGRN